MQKHTRKRLRAGYKSLKRHMPGYLPMSVFLAWGLLACCPLTRVDWVFPTCGPATRVNWAFAGR